MKQISLFTLVICSALLLGCNKEIGVTETVEEATPAAPAFTLTATNGDTDTKLTFDEDGLNTTWQPGDMLYVMDLNQHVATVEMTTDIESPSKTAKFTSQTAILPGEYVVVYGTSRFTNNAVSLQIGSSDEFSGRIRLTAPLTVVDGQTSASIALKHAFAKLTFTFSGLPSGLNNMRFGMAAAKGLQTSSSASISVDGWKAPYSPRLDFTPNASFSQTNGSKATVLIAPSDLSGDKAYFYISGKNSKGQPVTYELVKTGINLKAGVNYNITLNFSNANVTTFTDGYHLKSASDFRAALYHSGTSGGAYYVDDDIDFANDTYLPLPNGTLYGQSHVLNNVKIDMEINDYVGLLEKGHAESIIIKNASIKGNSYVGGIVGYGYATNCGVEGTVAGLGDCVGGIVGKNNSHIYRCYFVGNVTGSSEVGGIVGNSSDYTIYDSYVIGDVTSLTGYLCGGISGCGHSYNCYSYGNVSTGYGITGASYTSVINCLTSSSKLSSSAAPSEYINCGPSKTFVSLLSVINGNEAYSNQTWKGIDAGCPLLRWQAEKFGGDITAPGFGNENW